MNATTSSVRPTIFLRHQDTTSIVFYLTSRVPEEWAIWIRSHGGSVAPKPADAQFVIFPTADLSPREQLQLNAFKKRDVPTVRLEWLIRMRRLRCVTSWTQWACDPAYRSEPLVEDQELAVQLRMLGVDNIEDESVDQGEIWKTLSRRFPHHPIEFLKEQLRGHDPDNPSSTLPDVPEAAVPSTPSLRNPKTEPTVWFLPTPTSLGDFHGQPSQSQSVEEEFPLDCHAPTLQLVAGLFRTPRASILEDVNTSTITSTQPPPLEPGHGEEGQEEEGGVVLGSPEDEFIYGGLSMSAPSPILEHPHSATPLEQLFWGSRSQESPLVDNGEMDPLHHEPIGIPPLPPNDANTAAQLFHGIDNLSNWEPTPSIHSYVQRDRPPPTFDKTLGLWYDGNTGAERYQPEDNVLYKEIGRVQASRVREEELQYGWELVGRFIRTSTWIGPAQLGKQINRLFRVHGGKINWVEHLGEESNHKKVQELRREAREVHWRGRNPDADEEPPTHKWFTFGQAVDPVMVRASPPELSGDEHGGRNLRRSRPKKPGSHTKTAAGVKRKRATGPRTKKAPNMRRDGVLASSSSSSSPSSLSASSSSSSTSSSRKEGLSASESSEESVRQGRKKRRRFD